MSTAATRTAGVLAWLLGVGFGLPDVFGIRYFAQYGTVWTLMGFPAYGNGPFARAGIPTTVPLLVAFLVICVAELAMGWLLWRGRRSGTVLAFALLPFELAFWVGFALPFGFVFGAARSVLVILALLGQRRSSGGPRLRVSPSNGR